MALFNTPDLQPDRILRALRAALDMPARLTTHRHSSGRDSLGYPDLHFGVAITVGEAIVGNVGTAELFNATAIGDRVNLAKRRQERAAPDQIVLSQAAYGYVHEQVRRPLAPLQFKGRVATKLVYDGIALIETAPAQATSLG